jgi:5'-3' exonuclease
MDFTVGVPFPSLAQLLAVLPPQSAELLPKPLAELMINNNSPLKQYYPYDYITDANGKRQSWEALVLIPFIDVDLLLTTVQQILTIDQQIIQKKLLLNAKQQEQ